MTEARFLMRAALAALLAVFVLPQPAQACVDGNAMRYYFLQVPPDITPDIMFVQVTIVNKNDRSVEARLVGRFAKLSANHMIHIQLPIPPYGDNCVDWGTVEGPVYVVASLALVRDGHASIVAEPMKGPYFGARRELEQLRRNARVTYPGLGKP